MIRFCHFQLLFSFLTAAEHLGGRIVPDSF